MFDEELTGRLARLGDEIEDATVLAPAPAVRNRGDRRRTVAAAAAVAGMTMVAVTAGLAVASMGASPFWTSGPGGPSHATTIPATLVMLHEGENGWWRNDDPRVPGVVNPCLGADATLPGRTDARTLTGPGLATEEAHSPSLVTHQLFLYRDDAAAATVFNKLFTEGAACGWEPGGSAAELRLRKRDPGTYQQVKDRYWMHEAVVVQDGNALFLASSEAKGAGMPTNIGEQELTRILELTCRARLVCRPRTAPPTWVEPEKVEPGRLPKILDYLNTRICIVRPIV